MILITTENFPLIHTFGKEKYIRTGIARTVETHSRNYCDIIVSDIYERIVYSILL